VWQTHRQTHRQTDTRRRHIPRLARRRAVKTRDPFVLTQAFITYVRPLLEYCTSFCSPYAYTVSNINKIESCQRWFTKRIKGMSGMQYSEQLVCLNLESLQTRRLKCDWKMCYKIIHNEIAILNDDFFVCSRSLHILEDIITNYLRAVLGSIHTSVSFRIVLLKSGMLCLVQW